MSIAVAGHDAMQAVVRRQIETGIDVINNGEQQREGFFLYVQRRMTGFAGSVAALAAGRRGTLSRVQSHARQAGRRRKSVEQHARCPPAIGDVAYLDPRRSRPSATTSPPRWRRVAAVWGSRS